jgi:hypothetical protein
MDNPDTLRKMLAADFNKKEKSLWDDSWWKKETDSEESSRQELPSDKSQ